MQRFIMVGEKESFTFFPLTWITKKSNTSQLAANWSSHHNETFFKRGRSRMYSLISPELSTFRVLLFFWKKNINPKNWTNITLKFCIYPNIRDRIETLNSIISSVSVTYVPFGSLISLLHFGQYSSHSPVISLFRCSISGMTLLKHRKYRLLSKLPNQEEHIYSTSETYTNFREYCF